MSIEIVEVKDNDKIVFSTDGKEEKTDLLKTLDEAKGIWKNHPVFGKMNINQIIEYLRGEDSDV